MQPDFQFFASTLTHTLGVYVPQQQDFAFSAGNPHLTNATTGGGVIKTNLSSSQGGVNDKVVVAFFYSKGDKITMEITQFVPLRACHYRFMWRASMYGGWMCLHYGAFYTFWS